MSKARLAALAAFTTLSCTLAPNREPLPIVLASATPTAAPPSPSPPASPTPTLSPLPTPGPTGSPRASTGKGPIAGRLGAFSYEIAALPTPLVTPTPPPPDAHGTQVMVLDVDGLAHAYVDHELFALNMDDATAELLCNRYGLRQSRETWPSGSIMRHFWVPTPDDEDPSDLPALAARDGLTGHYRFHSWSGAVFFLRYLRIKFDPDTRSPINLNAVGDGWGYDYQKYGQGSDCARVLAGLPPVPVQGLVGYKRSGNDLELEVAPDIPDTTRRGNPYVYGCGTVVGQRLEVALFYLEDLPSGITACDYVIPITFKDVSEGTYEVIEAGTGRKLTTLDVKEPEKALDYVPWPCFG